eukprot:gene5984-9116_t
MNQHEWRCRRNVLPFVCLAILIVLDCAWALSMNSYAKRKPGQLNVMVIGSARSSTTLIHHALGKAFDSAFTYFEPFFGAYNSEHLSNATAIWPSPDISFELKQLRVTDLFSCNLTHLQWQGVFWSQACLSAQHLWMPQSMHDACLQHNLTFTDFNQITEQCRASSVIILKTVRYGRIEGSSLTDPESFQHIVVFSTLRPLLDCAMSWLYQGWHHYNCTAIAHIACKDLQLRSRVLPHSAGVITQSMVTNSHLLADYIETSLESHPAYDQEHAFRKDGLLQYLFHASKQHAIWQEKHSSLVRRSHAEQKGCTREQMNKLLLRYCPSASASSYTKAV